MMRYVGIGFLILLIPVLVNAQVYKWVDEKGNINFTDNYQNVPERYRDRVIILNIPKSEGSSEVKEESKPLEEKKVEEEELYGGHSLDWWKDKFGSLNKEIEELKNSIEFRRSYIKAYQKGRRLGAIYTKDQIEKYRYNKRMLVEEEKRYNNLLKELDELRRKARFYGVPREVRGE